MIFAVDGNWYLHRVFHTGKDQKSDTISTRFLEIVCRDAILVKATKIVVAFDGGDVFRYKLSDSYKSHRKADQTEDGIDPDGPYQHLESVKSFLARLGIQVIQLPEYEADDVLCSLATQNPNVVVATTDKDALQYLLRDDIKIYDSSFKPAPRYLDREYAKKKMGVYPEQCLDLQTLIGDAGDNVPKLLKASKALAGLKEHGTIKNWAKESPEFYTFFKKRKAELVLNRKLVRLIPDLQIEIEDLTLSKHPTTNFTRFRETVYPKSKGLFNR